VFASDGVWDNLNSQDILRIVSLRMTALQAWRVGDNGMILDDAFGRLTDYDEAEVSQVDTLQGLLAASIAGEAKMASLDIRRNGPFAKEVRRYFPGENWDGGKPDDICVIVCVVLQP
jgi:protein phosphatase PTC7